MSRIPYSITTAVAQQVARVDLQSQIWLVCCCLSLPVLWGIVVHLIFRRFRKKGQPDREQEAGWPDYQI